ncbi:MAG: hypothetical protein ACI4PF_01105 [Christensenellales bacterium]
MDISVEPAIQQGLQEHFTALYEQKKITKSFYPAIVGFEPSKPTYPMLKIAESRNVPYANFSGRLETVASLGYKVDIYAKTSGSITKKQIARQIAKDCNDYLTCIGLRQVSWNYIENDGVNGDLYHIIIMYSANYWEQRGRILL